MHVVKFGAPTQITHKHLKTFLLYHISLLSVVVVVGSRSNSSRNSSSSISSSLVVLED